VNDQDTQLVDLKPIAPVAPWPLPPIAPPSAEAIIPFTADTLPPAIEPLEQPNPLEGMIRHRDFGAGHMPISRILVLKLDHFGDFIISLPALRELRAAFPNALIRLVCGDWNERNAAACGLVDEIRCFNFFPEHPHRGDPAGADDLQVLDRAAEGKFDLAIDLRVDEDTRHLLARVDAVRRCGIGSASRFPLLDIALPDEHAERANSGLKSGQFRFLSPNQFNSSLPIKTPFYHAGAFARGDLVHGPYTELPVGRLVASVGLTLKGYIPGPFATSIRIDVVGDGNQLVNSRLFGRRSLLQLRREVVEFEFDNPHERSKFEFRIRADGRPMSGTVRFSGVSVQLADAVPPARFRPVEVHVGEKLSLLVALIRERTSDLYRGLIPPGEPGPQIRSRIPGRQRIAVAPFSNSTIRDWPPRHYARLISLLLERLPCEILLLGTPNQVSASQMLMEHIHSPHLINLIGRTAWSDLPGLLRSSDLVICNNSGIAHLAAAAGSRVLAIYSGSHQPQEWGPRGERAQAIMLDLPCSPCGFERLSECSIDHACMKKIMPEYVLEQAAAALQGPQGQVGTMLA
jgi:ADP-heptose:LPS heptosyltransferase